MLDPTYTRVYFCGRGRRERGRPGARHGARRSPRHAHRRAGRTTATAPSRRIASTSATRATTRPCSSTSDDEHLPRLLDRRDGHHLERPSPASPRCSPSSRPSRCLRPRPATSPRRPPKRSSSACRRTRERRHPRARAGRRGRRCCRCSTRCGRVSTPTPRRISTTGSRRRTSSTRRRCCSPARRVAELSKLAAPLPGRAARRAIERYGDRPTQARSFLQPASETTFGFRAGRWLTPLDALVARADDARFPVQLGGLIGDRDGLSDAVCDAVAQRLGLDAAPQRVAHRPLPGHRPGPTSRSTSRGGPRRWRATSRCSRRSAR